VRAGIKCIWNSEMVSGSAKRDKNEVGIFSVYLMLYSEGKE
jgi:hypothetical protein